jgi:hypothetical protein
VKESSPQKSNNDNSKAIANNVGEKAIALSAYAQSKLTISAVNDPLEKEADTMADKIMRMTGSSAQQQILFAPPISYINHNTTSAQNGDVQKKENEEELIEEPLSVFKHERVFDGLPFPPANNNDNNNNNNSIHRKCVHCEAEETEQLINRKEDNTGVPDLNNIFENYVSGLDSYGSLLSAETKTYFEPRFGYDFSDVKVHTDSVAAKSADSINALAYTSGNNIVFNQNQFSPETGSGKRLLAHELTHVVQQEQKVLKKSSSTSSPFEGPSSDFQSNSSDPSSTKGTSDNPFGHEIAGHVEPTETSEDLIHEVLENASHFISIGEIIEHLELVELPEGFSPIGWALEFGLMIWNVIDAFGEGKRINKARGRCYGLMFGALNIATIEPKFLDYPPDTADELRDAWVEGVTEGRNKALNVKVRNAINFDFAKYMYGTSPLPMDLAGIFVINDIFRVVHDEDDPQKDDVSPLDWPSPTGNNYIISE